MHVVMSIPSMVLPILDRPPLDSLSSTLRCRTYAALGRQDRGPRVPHRSSIILLAVIRTVLLVLSSCLLAAADSGVRRVQSLGVVRAALRVRVTSIPSAVSARECSVHAKNWLV